MENKLLEYVNDYAKQCLKDDSFPDTSIPFEYYFIALLKVADVEQFNYSIPDGYEEERNDLKNEIRFLIDNKSNTFKELRRKIREDIRSSKYLICGLTDGTLDAFQKAYKDEVRDVVRLFMLVSKFSESNKEYNVIEKYFIRSEENVVKKENIENKENINKEKILNNDSEPNNIPKYISDFVDIVGKQNKLRTVLQNEIFDQDMAIDMFVTGVTKSLLFANKQGDRPLGIFLFAGPPGVGKTFLAKTGAEALGYKLKIFDMSSYSHDEEAVFRLVGMDSSYKWAKTGFLTSFVRRCNEEGQKNIIIFDEIEKASLRVLYLLLQMLEEGRLQDAYNEEMSYFNDSILIFTTNAGRSLYEKERKSGSDISKAQILQALADDINPTTQKPYFPAAILSRMGTGYVVMFQQLQVDSMIKIAEKEFSKVQSKLKRVYNLKLDKHNQVPFLLLLKFGGTIDARNFRAEAEKFLIDNILELNDVLSETSLGNVLSENEKIRITIPDENELDRLLYPGDQKTTVMLVRENSIYLNPFLEELKKEDSVKIVIFNSYEDAKTALNNGSIMPDIVMVDYPIPKVNSDDSCKTVVVVDHAPIESNMYRDFSEFIQYVHETEDSSIYVVDHAKEDKSYVDPLHLRKLAINGTINSNSCSAMETVKDAISNSKLRNIVKKFAREHKGVDFDIVPTVDENGINLRVRNFRISNRVSGEDSEKMLSEATMPSEDFDDIIGGASIKKELFDFISFLQNPRQYLSKGGQQPKGLLLYGPPGTGKTFLAKALAHEAKVPFFARNGSSFVQRYVGTGPMAVRDLFDTARKYAPSIVFIDEVDAIGSRRSGDEGIAYRETLNMLLSEMDGFDTDPKRPVFVIAATNAEIDSSNDKALCLDPALVSRFSRTVKIDLPVAENRKEYLTRAFEVKDEDLKNGIDSVTRESTGMSFRNLKNIVELAKRNARAENKEVDSKILMDAFATCKYGDETEISDEELKRVAVNLAGQAIVLIEYQEIPEYISAMPRGNAGGYISRHESKHSINKTKKELVKNIMVALGGRAAEMIVYGNEDISAIASNDINKAIKLAKEMQSYGMDSITGLISGYGDARLGQLLNEYLEEDKELINDKKLLLDKITEELFNKNKLTHDEIEKIIRGDD